MSENEGKFYVCTDCAVKFLRKSIEGHEVLRTMGHKGNPHFIIESNCQAICDNCKNEKATSYIPVLDKN